MKNPWTKWETQTSRLFALHSTLMNVPERRVSHALCKCSQILCAADQSQRWQTNSVQKSMRWKYALPLGTNDLFSWTSTSSVPVFCFRQRRVSAGPGLWTVLRCIGLTLRWTESSRSLLVLARCDYLVTRGIVGKLTFTVRGKILLVFEVTAGIGASNGGYPRACAVMEGASLFAERSSYTRQFKKWYWKRENGINS